MLTIDSHPDPSTALNPDLKRAIAFLYRVFEGLRGAVGLDPLVRLDVVITSDFQTAVRDHADTVVGIQSLDDFHTGRMGGIVRGKALPRDKEGRLPLVILDAWVAHASTPEALTQSIFLVAHEFAHVLIGQTRVKSGTTLDPTGLPWGVAKWLIRFAMEEYLADVIANEVLRQHGNATTDDGQVFLLSSRVVAPYSEIFIDSATAGLKGLINIIHDYRLGRWTIDEMWVSVHTATKEILITLAHGQSELDAIASADNIALVTNTAAFGPLHVCWVELQKLFRGTPPLIGPEQFGKVENYILNAGSDLILAFWNGLGLSFTPVEDTFHMAVAHPSRAWSGPTL